MGWNGAGVSAWQLCSAPEWACCFVPLNSILPLSPAPPAGTNLSTPGTLHVWIDGASLCASTTCGRVLFNGAPPLGTLFWSDTLVQILVQDPGSDSIPNSVQVIVGDQTSNTLTFLKPVPNFNALAQVRWTMGPSGGARASLC